MAIVIKLLIILTAFLHSVVSQQTNGSIIVGASLTATPDNSQSWLSSSGDFAFGFQPIQGNNNFLLSIWYDKIPEKTIVWYPKGGPMVGRGSKVELTGGSGLVLTEPQGKEVWSSGSTSDLAYGVMNDTGNFVIFGSDSRKVWESFSFPADTILPTQVLPIGGVMNSTMSNTNFSDGKFQLRLLRDGNLVINTVDILSGSPGLAYYASGTNDNSNSSNSGFQLIFDETGYMYVLRRNGERFYLVSRDRFPSGDYYYRATLDSDGLFTLYYYMKNPTGNTSWESIWFVPENICDIIITGSGACGLNNVCSLDSNRPKCECPQGFSLLDPINLKGDCKPIFTPSCDEGESNNGEDVFDFIMLTNINWPMSDYMLMDPSDEQTCKTSCLKDCFCAVAIYNGRQCWKKQLPLLNGKIELSNVKAFLKFRKGDRPPGIGPPVFLEEKKKQRSLILLGSVLLSTSVFVIIVLIVVICVGFFQIYKKKARKPVTSNTTVETNVPRFSYQDLVEATNGFKDVVGKGACGVVYKGEIGTQIVAVKKLDAAIKDGQKEFETEVNAIARTHHKNLVQLLGYCDEGEHRLLIYEYMNNGTLAGFLFEEVKLCWKLRSYIAVGIAKGLTYLHEDCSTQIIHCDIKPQNILLDEYYNAKIADFGMSKLLMIDQSRTNTGIRGTKGFVAPEWFRNTPVTVKVDVYSFGVLLLEIISCRKSVVFEDHDEDVVVLTDLAWDCYQEGKLDVFVENDLEALDDNRKLETFLMVGLWCVQENPLLRPTMKKVMQMLEGEIQVTEPPCPWPFSVSC